MESPNQCVHFAVLKQCQLYIRIYKIGMTRCCSLKKIAPFKNNKRANYWGDSTQLACSVHILFIASIYELAYWFAVYFVCRRHIAGYAYARSRGLIYRGMCDMKIIISYILYIYSYMCAVECVYIRHNMERHKAIPYISFQLIVMFASRT